MDKDDVQYAGFWKRFSAISIDSIPLMILGALVVNIFSSLSGQSNQSGSNTDFIINLLVAVLYVFFLMSSKWQATIGKKMVNIYVVNKGDFSKPSAKKMFVRAAIQYVPLFLPFIFLALRFDTLSNGVFESFGQYLDRLMQLMTQGGAATQAELDAIDNIAQASQFYTGIMIVSSIIWFGMAGWTKEKTALHDMICGTRVIFGSPKPKENDMA